MTLTEFKNRITAFLKGKTSPTETHLLNRWLQTLQDNAVNAPDTGQFHASRDRMLAEINYKTDNGSSSRVALLTWSYAAASIIVLVVTGYIFRMELLNVVDPVDMITYTTSRGQQRLIQLPDGTEVWLNAASTLQVPEKFRGDTRTIQLQGEAFFKVQHDPSKPFYVHSGKTFTRVLGTSFNVKAYSDQEPVDVTVVNGKVAVGITDSLGQQHEITRLKPNHHIRLDAVTHTAHEDSVTARFATAWTKQQLVFRQATLKEMVLTLERWYSVSIQIDTASIQATCTFSAEYRQGTPLEGILKALERTGKISYTRDKKTIIIYPRNNCPL